jgi:hypothetical protein
MIAETARIGLLARVANKVMIKAPQSGIRVGSARIISISEIKKTLSHAPGLAAGSFLQAKRRIANAIPKLNSVDYLGSFVAFLHLDLCP